MLYAILVVCALGALVGLLQLLWTNQLDLRLGQMVKRLGEIDAEGIVSRLSTLHAFARNSDIATNKLASRVVELEKALATMQSQYLQVMNQWRSTFSPMIGETGEDAAKRSTPMTAPGQGSEYR